MSFSLLPFTYTQATVIVSRFDSRFDCASPPLSRQTAKETNKETMGPVITADEWVYAR